MRNRNAFKIDDYITRFVPDGIRVYKISDIEPHGLHTVYFSKYVLFLTPLTPPEIIPYYGDGFKFEDKFNHTFRKSNIKEIELYDEFMDKFLKNERENTERGSKS